MPNAYPYKNPNGNHIIKGPLTYWAHTDAVRQIDCPLCKSTAGYHCETPTGRLKWVPHSARMTAFFTSELWTRR